MLYLTCLHCERRLTKPSKRHYCSILCKSATAKQQAKLKLAQDRHHTSARQQPTFDLTDIDCHRIEAKIASAEQHVFDGDGFRVKTAKQDADDWNELHDSWADKAADLDVWQIRRKDRQRYGGIVLTSDWWSLQRKLKVDLAADQPPEMRRFHLKTFTFEIDDAYDSYLKTSDQPYDIDLLNAG
jgi:hypothetical protein